MPATDNQENSETQSQLLESFSPVASGPALENPIHQQRDGNRNVLKLTQASKEKGVKATNETPTAFEPGF